MITSIADMPAVVVEESTRDAWDDSYVALAGKRAIGVIRREFGGELHTNVSRRSNAFLQDALANLVDKIMPFIHNKDGKLGSNSSDVRRRVLKGLRYMANARKGCMRLVGSICSMTGKYVVRVVEGNAARRGRTPVDNRYNAAKQRRHAKRAESLRKQTNIRERKRAVAA